MGGEQGDPDRTPLTVGFSDNYSEAIITKATSE